MSFNYNKILNIPDRCLINKKLTKAFFLRNFVLSAVEKKVLNNITNMDWIASIKPNNSNIQDSKSELYVYEEIQVMVCSISTKTLTNEIEKCTSLFQKHIPYPIVLIVENDEEFAVTTCDKRINQSDKSKRTIEAFINSPVIPKLYKNELTVSFFNALDFALLDKTNLEMLYKSYINSIVQFQSATITGSFNKRSTARTEQDLKHIENILKIEKEIITLSNQIKKETQLNTKVSLNVEIQKKRSEIENLKTLLSKL